MNERDLLVPATGSEGARKRCPWCAEWIRVEAMKCRFCGSTLDRRSLDFVTDAWLRPREGRVLAGVCAGLAEQFGISVTIVRLAFVLGTLFSGGVFLLMYLGLWLAMPDADRAARERGSREAPVRPPHEL